jgi:inorganic pyrophosphatase
LSDVPTFPGCCVECRLIGVVQGEQTEQGKTFRNDRLVAVSVESVMFSGIKKLKDLQKTFIEETEQFLKNYHQGDGEKFRLIGVGGQKKAWNCVNTA